MMTDFAELLNKHNIKISGIIHVGAHEAGEILDYSKNGIERVVLIEANPKRFSNLKTTLEVGRHCIWCSPLQYSQLPEELAKITKNYSCHNFAITDIDNGEIEFNLTSSDGGCDSIYKINEYGQSVSWTKYENIETIKVPTTTLDKLCLDNNYKGYNFLNIDVEGAELLVLKGAKRILGSEIEAILVEVQDEARFDGSCLKNDVENYLAEFGFVLVEYIDTGKKWGDGLYVKHTSSNL